MKVSSLQMEETLLIKPLAHFCATKLLSNFFRFYLYLLYPYPNALSIVRLEFLALVEFSLGSTISIAIIAGCKVVASGDSVVVLVDFLLFLRD